MKAQLGRHLSRIIFTQGCTRSSSNAASVDNIPGPKGMGYLIDVWKSVRNGDMHEMMERTHKKYGPIYGTKNGKMVFVNIFRPQDIEAMLRNEGKYPSRPGILPWTLYHDTTNRKYGVTISEGEAWKKLRSLLSKPLLRPQLVRRFTDDMNLVNDDFVKVLDKKMKTSPDGKTIGDIAQELYLWSVESSGILLFDTRLGCFDEMKDETREFIDAVQAMVNSTVQLMVFPANIAKALHLPMWRKHARAWDAMYRIGLNIANRKAEELKNAENSEDEESRSFLTYLLNSDLSRQDALINTMNMFGAGVDTTSATVTFALHLLASNPDKQRKLYEEIGSVIPEGQAVNNVHLQSLHYLKAVVKETMRLYPSAISLPRVLDKDTVLAGYHIPAKAQVYGCIYSMGRDESLFPAADKFQPERWMDDKDARHPFTMLPFGYGPRSCIGKRLAELEMYLILTKLCQQYEIGTDKLGLLETTSFMLLAPKHQVSLTFTKRS